MNSDGRIAVETVEVGSDRKTRTRWTPVRDVEWLPVTLLLLAIGACSESSTQRGADLPTTAAEIEKPTFRRSTIGRVVHCGDGTLADRSTGLLWEMKNGADGTPDPSNPSDVDNLYTWTSLENDDASDPDGTAFTVLLASLNGEDGEAPACLAGFCDWRLPTKGELSSIREPCQGPPCIDAAYGPNAVNKYWTGNTVAERPEYAWAVKFFVGRPNNTQKKFALHTRAVRSGSCR